MNILAVDTSAKAASCAIYKDGALFAESFSNAGLTHSQTIMPMIQSMLECSKIQIGDIGLFAVSVGPGSFTGLRIGISAVKGMAMAGNVPCVAVSTLEALAYNLSAFRGVAVPVMDARRAQVYTAAFECAGGTPARLTPDEALSIDDLAARLRAYTGPVMLVGDGAELCHERLAGIVPGLLLAPPNLRHQRAASVCAAAGFGPAATCSAENLAPVYLRLPQAERERLERLGRE